MIHIDVYFPSINATYDFQVDEEATVAEVVREIGEMMCKKEKSHLDKKIGEFFLCSKDTEQILPENLPLNKCGIENGSCLFMV